MINFNYKNADISVIGQENGLNIFEELFNNNKQFQNMFMIENI